MVEPNRPFLVRFDPVGKRARCTSPTTIMDAARQAGAGLPALCGGLGACGRCLVRVLQGQTSPFSDTEAEKLCSDERMQGYRLSRRIEYLD